MRINGITLDKFLEKNKKIKKIDFIKIDTEGHELEVLKGAEKTIKKFKPILMVEKNNLNFYAMSKILKKLNYEIYSFENDKLFRYSLIRNKHENLICVSKFNKKITKDAQKTLSINESIKNKKSFGGTSPQRVKQSIKYAIKKYL